ncbi:MAG TPA: hypothetical protein VKF17_18990 [Isosphaeraceae bacterium]|nr:hypothetical protein [Isosphaeraceae bacterium]
MCRAHGPNRSGRSLALEGIWERTDRSKIPSELEGNLISGSEASLNETELVLTWQVEGPVPQCKVMSLITHDIFDQALQASSRLPGPFVEWPQGKRNYALKRNPAFNWPLGRSIKIATPRPMTVVRQTLTVHTDRPGPRINPLLHGQVDEREGENEGVQRSAVLPDLAA